jgi:hypothetical protein
LQREYQADRDTILLTQNNHYNRRLGKCFVLIEWHYHETGSKTGSWYNHMALHDVFENYKYGGVSNYTNIGADYKSHPTELWISYAHSSSHGLIRSTPVGSKCSVDVQAMPLRSIRPSLAGGVADEWVTQLLP